MVEQVHIEDVTFDKSVISKEAESAIISDVKLVLQQINTADKKSESESRELVVDKKIIIQGKKIEDDG